MPKRKARTRPPTIVVIKGVEWCIQTPSSSAGRQAFHSNNISLLHLCDQCAIKIHFLSIKVCFGMEIV
ncbi:hypothetical protein B4907_16965 [Yersinia kristensenii]|nr:hypothetical protein B4907_16965 [Yersinia kristensenii]